MGLILEIQKGVLCGENTEQLLRKVKVASAKLSLEDVEQWVSDELEGYQDVDSLPSYRLFSASLSGWNPYHGWQPIMINDAELAELLTRVEITQGIGSIEKLVCDADGANPVLHMSDHHLAALNGILNSPVPKAKQDIGLSLLVNIVSQVRNLILDWTIELEKAGVVGQGMTFTEKERETANSEFAGVHIENFNGVFGSSNSVRHSFNEAQRTHDLSKLVEMLEANIKTLANDGIDTEVLRPILEDLSSPSGRGDPRRVTDAVSSLRNILEGATGSLAATGALHTLQQIVP